MTSFGLTTDCNNSISIILLDIGAGLSPADRLKVEDTCAAIYVSYLGRILIFCQH